jgi:anti-sigma factor RsiW
MPNSNTPRHPDSRRYTDAQLWCYLDGEMAATDAEALERAVALNAADSERLDELRLISDTILDGAPTPPAGFGARVAAASQLQGSTPRSVELLDLQRFVRRALIAAALLAAVGLGYLAFEVLPDLVSSEIHAGSDPLLEPR